MLVTFISFNLFNRSSKVKRYSPTAVGNVHGGTAAVMVAAATVMVWVAVVIVVVAVAAVVVMVVKL